MSAKLLKQAVGMSLASETIGEEFAARTTGHGQTIPPGFSELDGLGGTEASDK